MAGTKASLDDFIQAIVSHEAQALRLLAHCPALVSERVAAERFVEEVPHQTYLGDTGLHLAAAALKPDVVEALLRAGADPNAENRRSAMALHYACDPRPMSRIVSHEECTCMACTRGCYV